MRPSRARAPRARSAQRTLSYPRSSLLPPPPANRLFLAPTRPPNSLAVPPVRRPQTLKSAKAGVEGPCVGINWGIKEAYLSDADFDACFKVSRAAFEAMPKWKRDGEKKKVGLF